jgi:hypothetical protein
MPGPIDGELTMIRPMRAAIDPNLPGAFSKAQMDVLEAYEEADNLPFSENPGYTDIPGVNPVDSVIANWVAAPMSRRTSDEEYDQMTRAYYLTKRLQDIRDQAPHSWSTGMQSPAGEPVEVPRDRRSVSMPAAGRTVNPIDYPGSYLGEGLRWYDSAISMPVNALRMLYGAEGAGDDFSRSADTFLLGLPTFAKHGTFHPVRDKYENLIRQLAAEGRFYETPAARMGARPSEMAAYLTGGEPRKNSGSAGVSTVLQDFGAPDNDYTRWAGIVGDSVIDPDGQAGRGVLRMLRGSVGGAKDVLQDAAVPLGLEGIYQYQQRKVP